MNEYLIPLTSACTLVTLNYIAIKVRGKMLIESYEHLLAPLLTGLASIIMMLEPLPQTLGLIDLRSLPMFMAGLRYGLPVALLSTILPAGYSFILHENHGIFIVAQDLIAPALLSSLFHNKEYRNGFLDIPIRHGLQICTLVFIVRLVTHAYQAHSLSLEYAADQLFMLFIMMAAFILIVAMVNDENKNWRLQRQLELQANQDGLTHLPNLRSFISIASNAMRKRKVSIMMIDIDNFKLYNDYYGHLEGDQLLRDIASVLRHHINEQDYVARYGGEEFVLLSTEIDPLQLAVYAERLCTSVADRFLDKSNPNNKPSITISIGISITQTPQAELQHIISEADYALYESKHNGKNRFTFYNGANMDNQK
ncbi:GGDEF domain-containing protein [Paenibacillus sp. SYP-B3998]|uniref:GGDEF domain-containing protein n=1 Tax=Paenibacillus sp. SYP-B3998 TaxID=2678564 RepID=A0A6G4A264_9BACL|nr:GGDEF domain-containing protein [Paenibacillus sp. SYP-B3998]NEW08420.1 GGDEF domain-containing protein [Paenibacillus sp. SYP-B3998]